MNILNKEKKKKKVGKKKTQKRKRLKRISPTGESAIRNSLILPQSALVPSIRVFISSWLGRELALVISTASLVQTTVYVAGHVTSLGRILPFRLVWETQDYSTNFDIGTCSNTVF